MSTMAKPTITLYDIASGPPVRTFAPNPWKSSARSGIKLTNNRYALNFKRTHANLDYETSWTDLTEVAEVRKALGAAPVRKHLHDNSDFYTLPVLVDSSTSGKRETVGDSFDIALYLDTTYASSPALFPASTVALQRAFNSQVDKLFTDHVLLCAHGMPLKPETADEVKAEFCRRAGLADWDDFAVHGDRRAALLRSLEAALAGLAAMYVGQPDRPFLDGQRIMYADLIVGAWLCYLEQTLPASEFDLVLGWQDGHWRRLHQALDRIDAPIRIRRAIHVDDALLVRRILRSNPKLLHNPDTSSSGLSNSNLHLAASLGHLSIVKLLVGLGSEVDSPCLNDGYQTALMLAAAAGHTEVVHFLSQVDPNVILRRDMQGRDAIMEASKGGHDTVLQILLTYVPCGPEAAVRSADLDGNTALHFASSNGHLPVLRTLLAAGAEAEKKNIWSWTAIAYSATVEVEVYLKKLIADTQVKRSLNKHAADANKSDMKGGVRLVGDLDNFGGADFGGD